MANTQAPHKVTYGIILILLVIRMIAGAFYGALTAIAAAGPFAPHAGTIVLLMAGELMNVPAVIFFLLRKPYFPLTFLIATILHTAGGIVLSLSPAAPLAAQVLAAQTGLFIPIVIFDVLMLVYLAVSKRARRVFQKS